MNEIKNTSMADNHATAQSDSQVTAHASPQVVPAPQSAPDPQVMPDTHNNFTGGNYETISQDNLKTLAKKMQDHDNRIDGQDNRIANVEKDMDTNKLIMEFKDEMIKLVISVKDDVNKLALDTNDAMNKLAMENKELFNKAMDAINKLAIDTTKKFAEVDRKIDSKFHTLDRKNDRQFIILLIAIIAAMFGASFLPNIINWLTG